MSEKLLNGKGILLTGSAEDENIVGSYYERIRFIDVMMCRRKWWNFIARKYTQEELDSIIEDYNDGDGLTPKELGDKYNRNPSSIIHKLQDIGIYKNSNHRFTKEDIEFLREHYPNDEWDIIMKLKYLVQLNP